MPTSCLLPVVAQPLTRVGQQSCLSSSRINRIMEVTVGGKFVDMVANSLCVFLCLKEAQLFNVKCSFWPSNVATYNL